ncbi:hypothetical protein [Sorangium sp. So ce117]|uniref:hypothetical protein n=1 Tax=Sorangium sp. So ce117 TaxID=3133277 RepID=UPI003F643DA9
MGRFFVESLVGGAVGAAAGYGAYRGICDDEPCVGGALAGMGANFALTPLAVFGLGRAMGGHGGIGAAYWGEVIPFGVTSPLMASSAGLSFAIASTLMPFTSALFFELSSNGWAAEPTVLPKSGALPTPVLLNVAVSPLADRRGSLGGGTFTIVGQF